MSIRQHPTPASPSPNAPLLITTGEPSGIGMDIVLDVLARPDGLLDQGVLITADVAALRARAAQLGMTEPQALLEHAQPIRADEVLSLDGRLPKCVRTSGGVTLVDVGCAHPVIAGIPDPANATMVKAQLDMAHSLAMSGAVSGIVTGPLHKAVMIAGEVRLDNGEQFSGHTEYFMHKAGCRKVVMMLANDAMRVALVTTHLPLAAVSQAITHTAVQETVRITLTALRRQFGIEAPYVLVCGLNPHAGEDGHLGTEEIKIINPALQELQAQGYLVSLAMPADTLFTKSHLERCDAVIAMYHDQGLPVLKSHGFGNTVNITLGLPYVRTSVDHGTALTLAGTGQACSDSLRQAIKVARQMGIPQKI